MAQNVGGLFVSLAASAARFKDDMNKARTAAKSSAGGIGSSFKNASKKTAGFSRGLGKLKGAAIAAAGPAALGYLIKQSIAAADRIAKVADSAGISTDMLQELQHASDLAGISQETFNGAIQAFGKRIGEAKVGTGTLITILNKMDQSLLENVQSAKTVDDAFDLIINAAAEMESQMDRSALFAAAFGRTAGIEMTNLVKKGATGLDDMRKEAHNLGLIIDEDLLRSAEDATDQLSIMHRMVSKNLTQAVLQLAPEIVTLSKNISDSLPHVFAFVNKIMELAGLSPADPLKELEPRLAAINDLIVEARQEKENAANLAPGMFADEELKKATDNLNELLSLQKRLKTLIKEIKDERTAAAEKAKADAAAEATAEQEKLKAINDNKTAAREKAADDQKQAEAKKKQIKEEIDLEQEKFDIIAGFSATAHEMTTDQFELERQQLALDVENWRAAGVMKSEIDKMESQRRKDIAKGEFDYKLGLVNQFANAASNLADKLLDWEKTQIQGRMNANLAFYEGKFNSEIEHIEKTYTVGGKLTEEGLQRQAAAESTFQTKKDQLRDGAARKERAAARKYKAIKIAQAISNTAVAVTEALPNIPLAILIGVAGAVEVGTIAAQPYAKGGVVSTASYFADARNGGWGVAGEKPGSSEGILPLARMPSGDLGVQAAGVGGNTYLLEQHLHFEGITPEDDVKRRVIPMIEQAAKNAMTDIITTKNPKQSQLVSYAAGF